MMSRRIVRARYSRDLIFMGFFVAVLATGVLPLDAGASKVASLAAPGLMVDVGAHRLHLHCQGVGRPTVVMDAGLGGTSLEWVRVQPKVAQDTRVCVYDRAGYGWSETGPSPRTSRQIAEELHALLHQAGVAGPYLLVGHSFGGYNVRLFASLYPKETTGLILVDASHEAQVDRFRAQGIEWNVAPRGSLLLYSQPRVPSNLPAEVREAAQSLALTFRAQRAAYGELRSFRASAEQVREAGSMPDVPTVVITRGQRVWPETLRGNRMEALWVELQDDLAARRVHTPHVFARNSGHYVHLDQPEVVIDAIRGILGRTTSKVTQN